MSGSEVLIYQDKSRETQVRLRLDDETVWLTQGQMAALFGRERSVVTKHLGNVFKEKEFERKSNVQRVHIAGSDKLVEFYNLDVIIPVGYRVKSIEGTRFRQWAKRVLRHHLAKGYTFHQTRLAEQGIAEAQQTLELLSRTLQNQSLVDDTGRAVLDGIVDFSKTWTLLLAFDEDRLPRPDREPWKSGGFAPGTPPNASTYNSVAARASPAYVQTKHPC
jgi:hypothetical protein